MVQYDHEMPVGEDLADIYLSEFAIYMALSGKHKSIRTYISMGPRILIESMGISFKKISERPSVARVLKSIERVFGKKKNRKEPVTINDLRLMAKIMKGQTSLKMLTIWAAILIAFFTLVRKSAYCAETQNTFDPIRQLQIKDLGMQNNRMYITLKKTKTIQTQERELQIMIPRLEGQDICPTAAVMRMLKARKQYGGEEPLFVVDTYHTPLTQYVFRKEFTAFLRNAGIPTDNKAPHSLRRGGTTCALESGCNPTCIKIQGDWASDAYLIYVWVTDTLKMQMISTWEKALGPGKNPGRMGT